MLPARNLPVIRLQISGGPLAQMRETIRRIGRSVRAGSQYLPLRNYAAALATTAAPKDYLGQARAIYDDLTRRKWRYVKDPVSRELVSYSPEALYRLVLGGDGVGVGLGRGAGDCDCISALSGALLESIGIRTRLGVTAPPGAPTPGRPGGDLFSHVFVQGLIPGRGWMTFDPVLYPAKPLGATARNSRIAFFDLNGRLISKHGNVSPNLRGIEQEVIDMYEGLSGIPPVERWPDYGPMLGFAEDGQEPDDWRLYGLRDFGAHAESMGIMGGLGLAAEVDYQLINGQLIARTPMLELAKEDYRYLQSGGLPYDGMMALGDDTSVYMYDGSLGFFKRLWSGIKKVGKRIAGGVKKVIKKIPGGKYIVKLGQKIFKVASKFVRPLARFVGKYATKLAPVAALIPGYGPAIAAAMYSAGKVANLMNQYGVKLTGPKGKARGLKFKDKKSAKKFKKALERAAKKQKKKMRSAGSKRRAVRSKVRSARRSARRQSRRLPRSVRRFGRFQPSVPGARR